MWEFRRSRRWSLPSNWILPGHRGVWTTDGVSLFPGVQDHPAAGTRQRGGLRL